MSRYKIDLYVFSLFQINCDMANTTYHSKSVGNVESIFFVAKENIENNQQKVNIVESSIFDV